MVMCAVYHEQHLQNSVSICNFLGSNKTAEHLVLLVFLNNLPIKCADNPRLLCVCAEIHVTHACLVASRYSEAQASTEIDTSDMHH